MNRLVMLMILLLGLLTIPVGAQSTLTVGIDQATRDAWTALASQFQAETGIKVTLHPYPQTDFAQQIVFQQYIRTGKLHLVMIHKDWGAIVQQYLADLSDYASQFRKAGLSTTVLGGKLVGGWVPFAPEWFLAVLSWPDDHEAAVAFLEAVGKAEVASKKEAPPVTPQGVIATYKTKKIDRADHNPRIDGSLEVLLGAVQTTLGTMATELLGRLPQSARAAVEGLAKLYGVPFSPATSTVTVVLESPGRASANVAALSALGVNRGAIEATTSLIKVSVPLGLVKQIAAQLGGITFIRPPYIPYPLGITGQGVVAIGADAFHAAGITGSGVKVAIIDLGFAGLSQAQARGDIPYSVSQHDLTGTGLTSGITHGTAVTEIVHEIAPGAQLHLIKIGDEVDLDQAVTYCQNNGIDIINHSLGWYNTNFYDGTGTIAEIARRAIQAGILWINAAGNEAQSHWEGIFTDGNSDGWHDQSLTFHATSGSQVILYVTWNDWPQAGSDYDLYLYDPANNVVASSTKHQTGTEEPTESIITTVTASGTYTVRFKGTGSKKLEIYNLYQDLSPAIAASSILAPANVGEVVAVGAIDYARYTTGPQGAYSSQGPTNDGRAKPDLCAPDNVSTGTSPYSPFVGTSGAAPHAAGAAALLLSQQPSLTEPTLRARLLLQTVAMGSPYVYGQGRLSLSLPSPPNQPPTAAFTYSPPSPMAGATATFNGSGSNDPDGTIVSYSWSFGDGSNGSGVSVQHAYASPGTYSVRLTVTDDDGASDTTTQQVSVTEAAKPDLIAGSLSYSPPRPAIGESVTFTIPITNQGSAAASLFRVRLAGAASSTHTYLPQLPALASTTVSLSLPLTQSPETFTVTVDDMNQIQESNEGNNSRQVAVETAPSQAPVAGAGGPYSGTVGDRLTFDGSHSSGAIESYLWSFGDGASGQGVRATHIYSAPGTYRVTLTVIGPDGQRSTDTTRATITQPAVALSIQLSLSKGTYQMGEPIVIDYTTNREAYVYICEADANGKVTLLFPNYLEPDNRVSAGTHSLPGRRYTLRVSEPVGSDTLYAFAATSPLPNFPTTFERSFPVLSHNPSSFRNSARQTMQSQLPPGQWAEDVLNFTVISSGPASGILLVNSSPQGASVTIDGAPSGATPAQIPLSPGTHSVELSLSGYQATTRQVTIVAGQTTQLYVPLLPVVANRPPVAVFTASPPNPVVGQSVLFNATGSYDPDGSIVSYTWDYGDGTGASGPIVSHSYATGATYFARLTVTDNTGAIHSTTQPISVSSVVPSPPWGGIPSGPLMGGTPGIFVWGTDTWHVTVNAGSHWTSSHSYRLELRTDGTFQNVNRSTSGGVAPLGVLPTPTEGGKTLLVEGSLPSGSADTTFTVSNANSIWMSLKLDIDGDGDLEESSSFVYLRHAMVHPPGVPFVVGRAKGESGPLVPSMNFLIGRAFRYTSIVRFVMWLTDIASLEGY